MRSRLLVLVMIYTLQLRAQTTIPDAWSIWFDRPAANWNEALPVGNGRLGAMIFGGIRSERLQLNESSVWTGSAVDFVNPKAKEALPRVRALLFAGKYAEAQDLAQATMMGDKKVRSRYQTLGDLNIEFDSAHTAQASDYERSLDLDSAIARVRYRSGGTTFYREIFSSAPDQALVVRLSADQKGALSARFRLSRPGNLAEINMEGNVITLSEHVDKGNGVHLVIRLKVLEEGGEMFFGSNGYIWVRNADRITLLLTAATDYAGQEPARESQEQMEMASDKTFNEMKAAHIADYQHFFKRVDLNLGATDALYFPTNYRVAAMQKGNEDPQLMALYYQFGRYLLISSSRPGGLPANLQGIWADGLDTPWDADYHININIQMNYWPSEICNLSELHLPFLYFLDAMRADGRKTARDMYGLHGTVAHFTTDAWHFTEPYGQTQWAMWPMGLAWGAQHFWEHYLFTEDRTFLENLAYPAMKDAALFCSEWLTENPVTKELVSGPSISPENTFKTASGAISTIVMGPTMDHMIIRNLLENTIAAATVLNVDVDFRKKLQNILTRLAPTKVGADGRILEWTEAFEEPEPGHRHISHLFALHPGNEITLQKHPELMDAARKTIDYRLAHGGGHTGWSRAWIINFFARLHDGESAYKNLLALLRKSTLPNLFDNHPPFQIDGNFGATAGITEMLLQSHAGEIELLPALPAAWSTGYIHGICARGGFEISLNWENGKLKQVVVLSKLGNSCPLRYGDQIRTLSTIKGGRYVLDGMLNQ